ncbi:MAG TPA: hypothetical protein VFB10_09655 [Candidatus Dormibacteraeota bacterium]|nr:hypothetical protein [Candidatus Dormibacteraeota bacterium]
MPDIDFSSLSPITEPGIAVLVAVLACLVAFVWPKGSERVFRAAERPLSRFAGHKILAIVTVFFAVLAVRLALLPVLQIPTPGIHDEFSYLLLGDTLAHGRLANPTHPMWRSFETFHVLWSPTYASKYPPAQGAVLALGQLLGHSWIGVLLSAAAMCAAIVWMLQAWMPARWAFLAGVLAAIKLCIACYWMNSYWGGAVAAFAGALVLGALARVLQRPTITLGVLLGLGIAVLANSRPYEGLFFCLPVAFVLLRWILGRTKHGRTWPQPALRVMLPVIVILLATFLFMGYYNWRVTGSPFVPPYVAAAHTYERFANFIWQKPAPMIHYNNPEMEEFYNDWGRSNYTRTWDTLEDVSVDKLFRCQVVFTWPALLLALPGLLFVYRDKRIRFLLVVLLFVLLAYFATTWPNPHYIAPVTCILFGVIVQAMRHLRRMHLWKRPIGAALSRAIVVLLIFDISQFAATGYGDPMGWGGGGLQRRVEIAHQLDAAPGKHLVIVNYSETHSVHDEWVYNGADIDGSKVVWARDLGPEQNANLMAYFKDRTVWVVEVGSEDATLAHFTEDSSSAPPAP